MKEFLEYAESHAEDILGTLRHMVEMESFTADKASTDALGGFIKERFEELGAQVRLVPQEEVGDHLVADVGGGDQQVLLLCHMDTVWPTGTIQQRPFRVEAGLGYGPGILDMKAGIAIALHALDTLRAHNLAPQQKVRILVNSDEEVGSTTSRQLIEEEDRKSAQVYCLEPGAGKEGALKTALSTAMGAGLRKLSAPDLGAREIRRLLEPNRALRRGPLW